MEINNKKKGFTLIELLIVIAIISVIMAMTIVSYSSINKRIALDISASRIENMIIEMREKARSGYFDDDNPVCFGFKVKKDSMLNQLKAPYDRLKGCITVNPKPYGVNNINPNIVINDLKLFGDEVDDFTMFFAPPNGIAEIEKGSITGENKNLQIIIGLKDNPNENDQRVIILNTLTGNTLTDKFNEKYK